MGVHASQRHGMRFTSSKPDGMVKQATDIDTPCIRERRALIAGGLAGAALPAGFKGVDPFGRVWGAAPTQSVHECHYVVY